MNETKVRLKYCDGLLCRWLSVNVDNSFKLLKPIINSSERTLFVAEQFEAAMAEEIDRSEEMGE